MNTQNDSMASIRKLAGGELSMKARLGYVGLLLAATGMTVVVVSLWATEAALPLRTQIAFGVMSVIGLAWAALSGCPESSVRTAFHYVRTGVTVVPDVGVLPAGGGLPDLTELAGLLTESAGERDVVV